LKTISAAVTVGLLTLLLGTGTATAAAPGAKTGGATKVSSGSARLAASVNPNGRATTVYFEYGTTRRYGSRTGDVSAGSGAKARTIRVDVGGLEPNRTYHYRVVASNPDGVASGNDRTFKTKPQPLGLQIVANPNPVVFGSPVTVAGTLTGTGNANRRVQLQARGFPYTSEFGNVGNPVVTDGLGNFSLPLLPPGANTQYRVQTVGTNPTVTSPVVSLGVAVRVGTNVTKKIVKRGRKVRFFGIFRPARSGSQFAIQKERRDGGWVNVAGGIARGGTSEFTRFRKRVRVRRGGNYRVFISIIDGNYVSGIGRTIRITSRR
jgi:hypothetical protein